MHLLLLFLLYFVVIVVVVELFTGVRVVAVGVELNPPSGQGLSCRICVGSLQVL